MMCGGLAPHRATRIATRRAQSLNVARPHRVCRRVRVCHRLGGSRAASRPKSRRTSSLKFSGPAIRLPRPRCHFDPPPFRRDYRRSRSVYGLPRSFSGAPFLKFRSRRARPPPGSSHFHFSLRSAYHLTVGTPRQRFYHHTCSVHRLRDPAHSTFNDLHRHSRRIAVYVAQELLRKGGLRLTRPPRRHEGIHRLAGHLANASSEAESHA